MVLLAAFRRRAKPDVDAVAANAAADPSQETGRTPTRPAETDGTFDMIEEDLWRVRAQIAVAASGITSAIDAAAKDAAVIVGDADILADTISAAHGDVGTMTAAFGEISAAGDEITHEIGAARGLAEEAQVGVERAGAGVKELDTAIARIESVVDLIAKVAKQTTLLALNATIEAERAGVAGRGFAVVAGEVKALSVETQRATDEINANIVALQKAARRSMGTVGEVVETIGRLTPSFAAVSGAVSRQGDIIRDAAALSDRTRAAVDDAATRASEMKRNSAAVADGVTGVRTAAGRLTATTEATTQRLMTVLRQTPAGDRRAHDRFPAFIPATLQVGGRILSSETVDLSEGGVLLRKPDADVPVGSLVRLDLAGIGPLDARIVQQSSLGLHVAFQTDKGREPLVARVAAIRQDYAALIDRCTQTAGRIGALFDEALAHGEIALAALFDTDYRPIAGTDPQQVETAAVPFLERVLRPIQEQLLATDDRMVFCAAVDRNGYLPVHNLVFSKPQRPGEPVWNTANCRNKRIFDDRAGLTAARNTRPFLVQAYHRDMGGGVTVLMKEVDAPITVQGRHWGGFRTAYKA